MTLPADAATGVVGVGVEPIGAAAKPAQSLGCYEKSLRSEYDKHWASAEFTEWAINFVMLHRIGDMDNGPSCNHDYQRALTARSLGYLYNCSNQAGLAKTMHWQGSPFNDGVTHYHRSHVSVPSKKLDAHLTAKVRRASGWLNCSTNASAIAVSSFRAKRAIARHIGPGHRIHGIVPSNLPVQILHTDGSAYENDFHTAVERSGYASSPSRVFETIVRVTKNDALLDECLADHAARSFVEKQISVTDDHPAMIADACAADWREIANSSAFKALASFSLDKADAPVFRTLARPMLASLRGLQSIEGRLITWADTPSRKLLLQYLHSRMNAHLERSVEHVGKPYPFINDMRLLHEEITTLLTTVQPYQEADVELHMIPAGTIKPVHTMRNSGLNVFNALLNTCEELASDGKMPRVVTQANAYYEIVFGLEASAGYQRLPRFDGGDFREKAKALATALPKGEKVDLFVGQIHDNISLDVSTYRVQPLLAQVRSMLEANLVSDHFTVAVDSTIGRPDAPDLIELIQALAAQIEKGRVNLIIFRSSLKFDLAGMDNVSSALITTYNNGDKYWKKFNDSLGSPSAMEGSDFQVACHLQKHAQAELNDYRSAIAKQHESMMKMLPPEMLSTKPSAAAVQIVPSEDPHTVFLHLKPSPELLAIGGDARIIGQVIAEVATSQGMNVTARPSLGHAHTTMAAIDARGIRISLGLESAAQMKMLADVIAAANDVGNEAIKQNRRLKTDDLFLGVDAVMKAYKQRAGKMS